MDSLCPPCVSQGQGRGRPAGPGRRSKMALASVCLGRKESSICSHIRMQHLGEATPTLGFHEFRFRDACLVERPCSGPVSSFLFPWRVENGRAGSDRDSPGSGPRRWSPGSPSSCGTLSHPFSLSGKSPKCPAHWPSQLRLLACGTRLGHAGGWRKGEDHRGSKMLNACTSLKQSSPAWQAFRATQ